MASAVETEPTTEPQPFDPKDPALAKVSAEPLALKSDNWDFVNSMADMVALAETMAGAGYFKGVTNAKQALAKMLIGRELGIGPAASLMGIDIIEGKPELNARLLSGMIKGHPKYDFRLVSLSDDACEIAFYEGGYVGNEKFTMKDAARAGLANKMNWKQYPRNMLFARCLSNGCKFYCSGIFRGISAYVEGELSEKPELPPRAGEPQPDSTRDPKAKHDGVLFIASLGLKKPEVEAYKKRCIELGYDWKDTAKQAQEKGAITDPAKAAEQLMQFVVSLKFEERPAGPQATLEIADESADNKEEVPDATT